MSLISTVIGISSSWC